MSRWRWPLPAAAPPDGPTSATTPTRCRRASPRATASSARPSRAPSSSTRKGPSPRWLPRWPPRSTACSLAEPLELGGTQHLADRVVAPRGLLVLRINGHGALERRGGLGRAVQLGVGVGEIELGRADQLALAGGLGHRQALLEQGKALRGSSLHGDH